MLRSSNELKGYNLNAVDGTIGRAKDFLFNDVIWVIRYLVADTGKWLPDREVLVSPISLGKGDFESKTIDVKLTQDQIKNCPALEHDKPVSRQFEVRFHKFFGWPAYWSGDFLWGPYPTPIELYRDHNTNVAEELIIEEDGDPHLRSMKEVDHYHIEALDGGIGHVEDFIIDEDTWNVRYLVVDTRNWLPGKKVTISPDWVSKVDYGKSMVYTDLSKQEIKDSPEYDPRMPVNREYEIQLYDFYGRPYYW